MGYVLISESTPKARKPHRCIWCGESIPVGETYRRERSVYDGEPQNHKWHLECNAAACKQYFDLGEEEFEAFDNERPPAGKGV